MVVFCIFTAGRRGKKRIKAAIMGHIGKKGVFFLALNMH